MRLGQSRSLKRCAWLLAAALLLLLPAAFDAREPAASGREGAATLSSSRWRGDAELIGGAQQAPFFRATKKPNLGLRSKTPPKRDAIDRAAAERLRPISLARKATPLPPPSEPPRSFLFLRTQNPRAPPTATTLTT